MGVRDEQITAECGVCGGIVELHAPGESYTSREKKTGPHSRTITYLHVGDCAEQWDEVWDDAVGDGAPEETKGGGTEAAATAPAPRQQEALIRDLKDGVDAAEAANEDVIVVTDYPGYRVVVEPRQDYLGRFAVERESPPGDWRVVAFRRTPEAVVTVLEHYRA